MLVTSLETKLLIRIALESNNNMQNNNFVYVSRQLIGMQ